ncbi:hypothetical protein SEA_NICOLETERA_8 [Mycobacterium phage NicoleTera]|nr:hypothetical protein SEA_NICOLETERA_8 [Mycobacterium phage NicoleTera]
MAIRFGTVNPVSFRLGTVTPQRIFMGNKLVWPEFTPVTQTFTTVSAFTYTIPANCSFIDVILIGGGGGGAGGGWALAGGGGQGGGWVWTTLVRGVDIPWSLTSITGVVGDGGAGGGGGASPGQGSVGSATSIVAGSLSLQAPGGQNGGGWGGNGQNGGAARDGNANGGKDVLLNGITYVGGAAVTSGSGTAGNPPGSGGRGGNAVIFLGSAGGKGARGEASFRAY